MRKPSFSTIVRNRLLRAGFTRAYAIRTARELQEHFDEIVAEGLRDGLSEIVAEKGAATRLGSPEAIAEQLAGRMQRSTWLGRHPISGFTIFALMLTILWWVALGSVAADFCGVFSESKLGLAGPPKFDALDMSFGWIRGLSYIILPWLCCHVAECFFCGWRPALWACLVLAIHNGAHFLTVTGAGIHGSVSWGYSFNAAASPSLLPILLPLAVFAIHRAWALRDEFQFHNRQPQFN